jgi:transposase, IS5 family
MLKATKPNSQLQIFGGLGDTLDQKHPLYLLANSLNWSIFDNAFKEHYSEKMGAPAKPIRLMVSLLILKHLRDLSDENLVEQWSENCYYQYLGGEQIFQPKIPCVPTELVAFRKRIGEAGVELILKESIRINKSDDDHPNESSSVSLDTTVQEKNITYPTDDKLYKKIIKRCWKIADDELIDLRQSYCRVVKKLSYVQRFKKKKNGAREARKANKKIQIIAGRLLRDIARKLPLERLGKYLPDFKLYQTILSQKRGDSNKIYSIHEPNVKCYSKGKEHKKFEFGSKASIIVDQGTGVIMGAINFTETLHDSKTIPEALEQYERLNGTLPKEVYVDRGYRGKLEYKSSKICIPKPNKNITKAQRKKHSKRAGIEPIISHLKQHYRLSRNYLKGIVGDNMNIILAAAAMNFKRRMNLWRTEAIFRCFIFCKYFIEVFKNLYALKLKMTF